MNVIPPFLRWLKEAKRLSANAMLEDYFRYCIGFKYVVIMNVVKAAIKIKEILIWNSIGMS